MPEKKISDTTTTNPSHPDVPDQVARQSHQPRRDSSLLHQGAGQDEQRMARKGNVSIPE